MTRSETAGVGLAALGHAGLLALLVLLGLHSAPPAPPPVPMEVSISDEVGLQSQAPDPSKEAAAELKADDPGPAVPPAAPPESQPAPELAKPEPPKAAPKPTPQPVPRPEAAKSSAVPADAKPAKQPVKPTGRLTGLLNGISDVPSKGKSTTSPAATMGPQARADIGSAITRQVQPCADRQVNPGPGSERILVTIRLQLNRDGSMAARPTVTAHAGVDDENRRYVDRVDDLAIATFVGCSPLKGLPDELYDVPNGWKVFSLRYKLPG